MLLKRTKCRLSLLKCPSKRFLDYSWKENQQEIVIMVQLQPKVAKKSSLDAQVSIRKEGNNRESAVMCLNPNASRGWNNRKSPAKSTDRRDSAEVRKPTCGSNGKESDRKIFPENGFISTRSDRSARPNDGSSLKRSGEGHFGGLRNRVTDSSVVGKEGILRKPFLETTNFRHNESLEITGKWKCPQKSKPNLGPPLKQLRLEQWVHRV
ncbi:hypothetical protein Acr_15g0005890 [Actinidia rufa]|uniref:Uncharacterized protein n=1 Tax=Actinidia rufa TaxID=165716 RepID=A0A7J0FUX1_9ERIC|nr:hypothetical protein Acr_15g0005890 [Actinidia rufa]